MLRLPTPTQSSPAQVLQNSLPQKAEINEEELFASVVEARLSSLKGASTAELFKKGVAATVTNAQNNKRRFQVEDVVTKTLDALVTKKVITQPERDKVYKESFRASQLDGDHTTLFDSIGNDKDPTKAVAERSKAITSAASLIKQIDAGTLPLNPHFKARNAGTLEGSGKVPKGFLFKPVSQNSGTLAILIPSELGKNAASVQLTDSSGAVIEKGRFTSYGETGERAKYAFSKPGSSYPKGIMVEVIMRDGTKTSVPISDPSKRFE